MGVGVCDHRERERYKMGMRAVGGKVFLKVNEALFVDNMMNIMNEE